MPLVQPPPELVVAVERLAPGVYRAFASRVNTALRGMNLTFVNWYRSPEHNRRVGGAPGSQHQIATAVDLVFPTSTRALALKRLKAQGLIAVDEGDHVHVQAYPANTALKIMRALGFRV